MVATKGSEPRENYVGSAACAGCHARIVEIQKTTQMRMLQSERRRRLSRSPASPVAYLTVGDYRYAVSQSADSSVYSASDGNPFSFNSA